MTEFKNESPSSAKRKPDLECLDQPNDPKKKKPEISHKPTLEEEKIKKVDEDSEEEEDEDGEYEDEDEEEDEDEGGNVEVPSNGKSVVDNKGKEIMKESKGKGKLEVQEGSEDSDSSGGGGLSDEDSDLSDDPLAEVDLDNILPSRTRRRVSQPGSYLVNDLDDDDDSDDSDAQV